MKEQPIGEASVNRVATDWKRLRAMSDTGIASAVKADSEARPTGVGFGSKRESSYRERLDSDLFGWLRQHSGPYIEAQKP